jgi:hypothetical protein
MCEEIRWSMHHHIREMIDKEKTGSEPKGLSGVDAISGEALRTTSSQHRCPMPGGSRPEAAVSITMGFRLRGGARGDVNPACCDQLLLRWRADVEHDSRRRTAQDPCRRYGRRRKRRRGRPRNDGECENAQQRWKASDGRGVLMNSVLSGRTSAAELAIRDRNGTRRRRWLRGASRSLSATGCWRRLRPSAVAKITKDQTDDDEAACDACSCVLVPCCREHIRTARLNGC